MQDRAEKKIKEGHGTQGQHYQNLLQQAQQEEANGNGALAEQLRQQAATYAATTGRDAWMDEQLSGTAASMDLKFGNLRTAYNDAIQATGRSIESNANALDAQSKDLDRDTTDAKSRIFAQETAIDSIDDGIKDLNSRMQRVNERESVAKANQNAVK